MITSADSLNTIDLGKYYAILPSDQIIKDKYKELGINFKNVDPGFTYNSGSNPEFLNVNEIQELIIKNVDPEFKPI